MFETKVVDIKEICILCHAVILCMISPFWRILWNSSFI